VTEPPATGSRAAIDFDLEYARRHPRMTDGLAKSILDWPLWRIHTDYRLGFNGHDHTVNSLSVFKIKHKGLLP
jgi:hypothetical protein